MANPGLTTIEARVPSLTIMNFNRFPHIISIRSSQMRSLTGEAVLEQFQHLIEATPVVFAVPVLSQHTCSQIAIEAREVFERDPTVLRIPSDIVVVGDLHGGLFDLFLILKRYGIPPAVKYLFLGDLVDRGEHSIQVVALVFALKILYANDVFVISGNHECEPMAKKNGFFAEMNVAYGNGITFDLYVKAFEYLPIAAVIGNEYLCVHGGITPEWTSLEQLDEIKRPIDLFKSPLVTGILWSDPVSTGDEVVEFAESPRCAGCLYGEMALISFLEKVGMRVLIRGHECKTGGYEWTFNGRVLTVFSASKYCGYTDNFGAAVMIDSHNQVSSYIYRTDWEVRDGRAVSMDSPPLATRRTMPRKLSRGQMGVTGRGVRGIGTIGGGLCVAVARSGHRDTNIRSHGVFRALTSPRTTEELPTLAVKIS